MNRKAALLFAATSVIWAARFCSSAWPSSTCRHQRWCSAGPCSAPLFSFRWLSTRSDVLSKDWTRQELEQVLLVPSLLVISTDFDDFSPRRDPWLILNFGQRKYGGPEGLAELDETIRAITEAVTDPDSQADDLYRIAKDMAREHANVGSSIAVQPGIFGVSIDIIQAGRYFREMIRRRRRRIGRIPLNETTPLMGGQDPIPKPVADES